jgi:hypothetical protein
MDPVPFLSSFDEAKDLSAGLLRLSPMSGLCVNFFQSLGHSIESTATFRVLPPVFHIQPSIDGQLNPYLIPATSFSANLCASAAGRCLYRAQYSQGAVVANCICFISPFAVTSGHFAFQNGQFSGATTLGLRQFHSHISAVIGLKGVEGGSFLFGNQTVAAGAKVLIEKGWPTGVEGLGKIQVGEWLWQIGLKKGKRYSVSLDCQRQPRPTYTLGGQVKVTAERVLGKAGCLAHIGKCEVHSLVTAGIGSRAVLSVGSRIETKISEKVRMEVGLMIDHITANCSVGVGFTIANQFLDKSG